MLSRDRLISLMREKVHHPASAREIVQLLRVPREERATVRRLLRSLVGEGELIQVRGHRFGLPDRMDLIVGRLEVHPSGFGFVIPERASEGQTGDIYVGAPNLQEALHGDRVLVRIERRTDDKRSEGRIVRILERRSTTIVGRFDVDAAGLGFVVPFDRRVLTDVQVLSGETRGAKSGEMVAVEITRWPTSSRGPLGRVVDVLGDVNQPGVDVRVIIRKFSLPDAHGPEAVADAQRIAGADRQGSVVPADLAGRTDFRSWTTVTIDGEHARDFDDAVSIERLANGHYRLGVHIADVSHYVIEGSALDAGAYERGTSVYFPDRAVHMFPEELATGLCSLNPKVDRLVQSCIMEINARGEVVAQEFHDGVIKTAERMTYTDVNAILADRDPETLERFRPLVPMFERMEELFRILNGRRRHRGSIDFDLSETEVVLDTAGMIEAIVPAARNIAHRLIEEFMLVANETVARYLEEQQGPSLFRIHEAPDVLKVELFQEFIAGFDLSLSVPAGGVRPRHFQKLIERIAGKPEERPVALLMLRTMQKARYSEVNVGHFGLAAESYTHFTSPIRRYPDLVVHRLLRAYRKGMPSADRREELSDDMPEIARHTSETERRADEAERELLQWKKVRFMADKVGDEFEGFVVGVAPFGLFVELVEHFVEGLVHVSSMADDYYRYLEKAHTLRGENTKKRYRLGDKVRVQVIRVDMEKRQIDLGLTDVLEAVRRDAGRREYRRPKSVARQARRGGPPARGGRKGRRR